MAVTQKVVGGLFLATGPAAWIAQYANVITVTMSVVTGTVFMTCAIINAVTKRQEKAIANRAVNAAEERNRMTRVIIEKEIFDDMEKDKA